MLLKAHIDEEGAHEIARRARARRVSPTACCAACATMRK
jgi:hypothetical protein